MAEVEVAIEFMCVTDNHCSSACFLWSKKYKHSSSNHGLCCFSSYRPRL